jgi:hypothetical protein
MDDSERDQLLIRLDERVDTILKRLEKGDKCMEDHDKRIGALERFQQSLLGIAATISFAIATAGSWIMSKLTGGGS